MNSGGSRAGFLLGLDGLLRAAACLATGLLLAADSGRLVARSSAPSSPSAKRKPQPVKRLVDSRHGEQSTRALHCRCDPWLSRVPWITSITGSSTRSGSVITARSVADVHRVEREGHNILAVPVSASSSPSSRVAFRRRSALSWRCRRPNKSCCSGVSSPSAGFCSAAKSAPDVVSFPAHTSRGCFTSCQGPSRVLILEPSRRTA